MARNGSGGPSGGAMRLAAALTSVAIAACLASVPRLAQALGRHDSPETAATLEILDDRGSSALEIVDNETPGVAAEEPVIAAAQAEIVASGSVGTAQYEYSKDGNQYTLTVKDGTFEKRQWRSTILQNKMLVEYGVKNIIFTNVTITGNASNMFEGVGATNINASGLNVTGVTNMSNMFNGCSALASLDGLSGWNTGSVTNMSNMFNGCKRLTTLGGLSNWNTGSVTDMSNMFSGCTSLDSANGLSGWNTGSVTDMSSMFSGCSNLTSVDGLSEWKTNMGGVTNMSSMFSGCTSLDSVDGLSGWDTGSVTNMSSMFSGCTSLDSVDGLSGWDTGSVTNMSKMFSGCSALDSLGGLGGLSNWNTSSVKNMSSMFQNCTKLTSTSLDVLSNWNTKIGSVTDMSNMFSGCTSLDSLDGLSGWVTSGVTNMSNMFSGCTSLNSLDGLSGWNTKMGSVTTMSNMFSGCTSLSSLGGLSNWKTGSVTYMSNMFNGCTSLASLDGLSGWDTGSVATMSYMFSGCTSLASVDGLSGWDTGSVATMSYMFSGCTSLASVDLSGWDTKKVTNTTDMFNGCSALRTIAVCDWNTGVQSSSSMFKGCTSLVGGNGTVYDASKVDKTYARVDGGADDPGYFTGKPAFRGCFLVLSGKIGVTFTLEAPQHFNATGAYVEFTVGNNKRSSSVPFGEFEPVTGETNKYRVTCGVTSLEMAEKVTAALHWSGESAVGPVTASCSVEDYAGYVAEHESAYGDAAVRLAKAINDYGYRAQLWLAREHNFGLGDGVDDAYAKMEDAYTTSYDYDTVKSNAYEHRIKTKLGDTDVTVSYRLHLDTATGISVRLMPGPDGISSVQAKFTDSEDTVQGTRQSDGSYVVRLSVIPAHRLAERIAVSGTTNSGKEFSVDVCVLSYVRTTLLSSEDPLAKDAMAALLEYYEAAMAFRGGGATA